VVHLSENELVVEDIVNFSLSQARYRKTTINTERPSVLIIL